MRKFLSAQSSSQPIFRPALARAVSSGLLRSLTRSFLRRPSLSRDQLARAPPHLPFHRESCHGHRVPLDRSDLKMGSPLWQSLLGPPPQQKSLNPSLARACGRWWHERVYLSPD